MSNRERYVPGAASLSTVGTPTPLVSETQVKRADAARVLEFNAVQPFGRMVGPEIMKFDGWQRLNTEYARQLGVETPGGSGERT